MASMASSIRGFAHINESDMLLMPDADDRGHGPGLQDPDPEHHLRCGRTRSPESGIERDPRYIAQKAEAYLKATGIADTAYFGPELEFFVFDSVSFDQNQHSGYYYIDSEEGIWNSGRNGTPEPGSPPQEQGRILPGPADRHAAGLQVRDAS